MYLYNSGQLDEVFDLDGNSFERWHDEIAAWLGDSRYAVLPEQIEWVKEASPFDLGDECLRGAAAGGAAHSIG